MPQHIHKVLIFIFIECIFLSLCYANFVTRDRSINARDFYNIMNSGERGSTYISDKTGLSPNYGIRHITNTTTTILDQFLWPRDGTTRKQYEIINLLWRKSKLFLNDDIYNTDAANVSQIKRNRFYDTQNRFTMPSTSSISTTTSNIEFYYMEDIPNNDEKQKDAIEIENKVSIINETRNKQPPHVSWTHLKGPYNKIFPIRLSRAHLNVSSSLKQLKNDNISRQNNSRKLLNQSKVIVKKQINKAKLNPQITKARLAVDSTTIYDKIKFFEIYDHYTEKSNQSLITSKQDLSNIETNEKILLEHVDQSNSHSHNYAKHSKKHIKELLKSSNELDNSKGGIKSKAFVVNLPLVQQNKRGNDIQHTNENLTKTESSVDIAILSYMSANVSWLDYPFIAVYVNEPSQVYCDAAGISPHWLVASASCLTRVSRTRFSGSQTPYVTYCAEQWWRPERVTYVKYSLVHPSFHPRDTTRRHLYNIGVIQVVTSMASACAGWSPLLMISYQFTADPTGVEASVLGWGLDRFVSKFGISEMPKRPLMIYKGLVYHGSCPGNARYSEASRIDGGSGLKNVHCLSLPPYAGEAKDPVHGSLMFFAGKLIALYLEEERRPWGHQSAQYTGIWHLIPWITEKAIEPDELEPLSFEL